MTDTMTSIPHSSIVDRLEHKQDAVCNGLTFLPIPEFTDAELAFGADAASYFGRRNLPKVPRKCTDEASRMFFSGGAWPAFGADVDASKAKRAIHALLKSFAPAHEAKEATVAYALWVWSPEAAASRALQSQGEKE